MQLKTLYTALIVLFSAFAINAQNTTPTYTEAIDAYRELAQTYSKTTRLEESGPTDSGLPLHTFIISSDGNFDPNDIREKGKLVLMIMNGIHPGEPCGVNASLAFASEKAETPDENIVYVIIPIYNIGGALIRNSTTRANQDGPEEYGFRGNATNLDLNRDFIKSDSKNAVSFARIYHKWKPEILVDTHTSNGADYQPNMTLLTTFPEKLNPFQQKFLTLEFEPALYETMAELGDEMVPYVNTKSGTPDSGINAFTDLARYSTGYASLFNTIGFTTEAHMLKPFDQRVASTLLFLNTLGAEANEKYKIIVSLKKVADQSDLKRKTYDTAWMIKDAVDSLDFPGYRADSAVSEVTGLPRLTYNRKEPYRKKVPYFRFHESKETITLPSYYVVSRPSDKVMDLLSANDIVYRILSRDSTIEVSAAFIENYETITRPYEGHYLHHDTEVKTKKMSMKYRPGDLIINAQQQGSQFLAEVFHPVCPDSYFNWNFFDSYLQQKEYFSPYVFEETAVEILDRNPTLRKTFEEKKAADPEFAANSWSQLYFIYKNSKYYEGTDTRMPVYYIKY